jgi:hypothetical protein
MFSVLGVDDERKQIQRQQSSKESDLGAAESTFEIQPCAAANEKEKSSSDCEKRTINVAAMGFWS